MGVQRRQELSRSLRDLRHRTVESRLVGLRRLVEAGQFANELERAGVDLILRRLRLEVEQSLDVAAHAVSPDLSLEDEWRKRNPTSFRTVLLSSAATRPPTRAARGNRHESFLRGAVSHPVLRLVGGHLDIRMGGRLSGPETGRLG